MDYETETDFDQVTFTAADAPERSTGWKDSYIYHPGTGRVEFFDAEANDLFHVAVMPGSDLAAALDTWTEDRDEDLAREHEARQDPYAVHGVRRSDFY